MPEITLEVEGGRWRTAADGAVRLSIPMEFDGPQPRAFGLAEASARRISFDDAICDTSRGGAFNCSSVSLIPHGNGTHTECVGHVEHGTFHIGELLEEPLIPCTVVTVEPEQLASSSEQYTAAGSSEDHVVTGEALAEGIAKLDPPAGFLRALVVRTSPNGPEKRRRDYTGTNPPYLTTAAVDWILDRGVEHLLVDLPSIDRERDDGRLANHRTFWGLDDPSEPPSRRTLTELCYVPNAVADGVYFLDIGVPDFALDAAPSRPLLYEAIPVD